MVNFTKHTTGDIVRVHCCDGCMRNAGIVPKQPPDSGSKSWFCHVCGHQNIGSDADCRIGDWLDLRPVSA